MKRRITDSDKDSTQRFKKIKEYHYNKLILPNDDPRRLKHIEVLLISFIASDTEYYKITKYDYCKKLGCSNVTMIKLFKSLEEKGYLVNTDDGYIFYEYPESNPNFDKITSSTLNNN